MLQYIRHRVSPMCGSTTLHGLVPTPSRALNNEVACKIEWWLKPSLDTCLIGLGDAAHLNGVKDIIPGKYSSKHHKRWKAWLDNQYTMEHTFVSKLNMLHVHLSWQGGSGDFIQKA